MSVINYIRHQLFAIFYAVGVLVGGSLALAVLTVMGVAVVLFLTVLCLVAPIIGISIKSGVEELARKAKEQTKQDRSNVTPIRKETE